MITTITAIIPFLISINLIIIIFGKNIKNGGMSENDIK